MFFRKTQTRLLKSHQIATTVINMIQQAKKHVYLISPYIKLWNHLSEAIEQALKRNVEVYVFIRADKLPEYENTCRSLLGMGANVFTVNLLHAKLYFNETECILTSMNLLDFSASNSEEVAFHVFDQSVLDQLDDYISDLKSKAFRFQIALDTKSRAIKRDREATKSVLGPGKQASGKGYCIRCKAEIDRNHKKPLCRKCNALWAKYANPTYQEVYCHLCGGKNDTSFSKPLCLDCFKQHA